MAKPNERRGLDVSMASLATQACGLLEGFYSVPFPAEIGMSEPEVQDPFG